ncbi:MAG: hypothetical protein M1453_14250 [Acidobacteria bacterium]|nr:hypothetical protein [Acidobacteriota bacterium]
MKTLKRFLFELLWICAAGICAWFFPKTALVIVAFGAAVTVALRMVERRWM